MVAHPRQVDHNLDVFLARLDGLKAKGAGWIARCPAHVDHNPSLSVDLGDDGRVLLHCFAGCETRDVLAALRLEPSNLFPTNGHRPELRRPRALGKPVATYDYRDDAGNLVYQAVRYEPKDFRPRRPDPSAPGGWAYKLDGVPRVLYRLADVLAADTSETVYYCEGEKDADAGAALGLLATTHNGGAENLTFEAAQALRGRRVAILPDNDKAGRKGAAKTAALLANLAADVRIVTLPGLPEAGDLSDWLAAGGTVEELARLTADAPRWTLDKASAAPPALGVLLADVRPERVSWLWPGYLPCGKLVVIDGDPGLGKSALTLDLAARLTTGQPFPDGSMTEPRGVLLLSAEDGLADTIRPRLDAAGADLTKVLALTGIPEGDGERPVTLPDDLPTIEQAIQRISAGLVVIDPLMAFLAGTVNSFRDQDVRRALAPLATLAERTGATMLVVRHLNKATGGSPVYRGGGSIGIAGAARAVLLVARDPDDAERRILASIKSNLGPPPPALAYHLDGTDSGTVRVVWEGVSTHSAASLLAMPLDDDARSAADDARDFLADALADGPVPVKDLRRAAHLAGIADRTLDRAKAALRIAATKEGFGEAGRWCWQLSPAPRPLSTPAPAYVRHTQEVTHLGEDGVLNAAPGGSAGARWELEGGTVDAAPARERVTL